MLTTTRAARASAASEPGSAESATIRGQCRGGLAQLSPDGGQPVRRSPGQPDADPGGGVRGQVASYQPPGETSGAEDSHVQLTVMIHRFIVNTVKTWCTWPGVALTMEVVTHSGQPVPGLAAVAGSTSPDPALLLPLTIRADDSDTPADMLDALALAPFTAGTQPYASTAQLGEVRPDASLLPPEADRAAPRQSSRTGKHAWPQATGG